MSIQRVFSEVQPLVDHIASLGNPRTVLAAGCFDPLHVGHIRYLRDAASHGDHLVVMLYDDASTRRLEGVAHPVTSADARAEVLAALAMVDAVLVCGEEASASVLEAIRPAVLAREARQAPGGRLDENAHRAGVEVVSAGDPRAPRTDEVVARIRRGGR